MNGKGDRNRSCNERYRKEYERIYGKRTIKTFILDGCNLENPPTKTFCPRWKKQVPPLQ